jgi:hypothetical protein
MANARTNDINNNCSNDGSCVNNIRTIYNRLDSTRFNSIKEDSRYDDADDSNTITITPAIYRYKFTQDFMDELYKFSKVHQYDDRKSFKEAWEIWTEESEDLISDEMERLEALGYDGDVLDKMFKSARYYFRKKSTSKPEPKERRKYVGVQKELLDAMDSHIISGLNQEDYKPSEGFSDFCVNNIEALKNEVERLLSNNLAADDIMKKVKKTYKNRYFMKISK